MRRLDDGLTLRFGGFAIVVIEQDRRQICTHVPLDVVGEHADEDVAAYAILETVMNGTDFQIDGLDRAKRTLDARQ